MRTYVIFNSKTGEVVHTHVEDEEVSSSPDDLLAMVDPSHDRKLLEVLEVFGISPGECYRVDVRTKTLQQVQPDQISGFGSASVRQVRLEGTPRMVKIVHDKDIR